MEMEMELEESGAPEGTVRARRGELLGKEEPARPCLLACRRQVEPLLFACFGDVTRLLFSWLLSNFELLIIIIICSSVLLSQKKCLFQNHYAMQ